MLERKTRYLIFQQGFKIRIFRIRKVVILDNWSNFFQVSELKRKKLSPLFVKDFLSFFSISFFWSFPFVTDKPGDYISSKLELFKHKRFTLFYI